MLTKLYKVLSVFFIFTFICINAYAQNTTQVKGVVTTELGDPLPGAIIKATNLNSGREFNTITDSTGTFTFNSLPINGSYSFLAQSMGFDDRTITGVILKNDMPNSIIISLKEVANSLDDVVVIGYGTQSRAKVTGAISTIKGEDLGNVTVSSFDQALAGRIPGVEISQTNGAPGSNVNVRIRGNTSINFGGQPLIVVDGLPLSKASYDGSVQGKGTNGSFNNSYSINPLSLINPFDIESIDVLKDAASTAIYGSRGSSGVMMVTTKKGKIGKPRITASVEAGTQILDKKVDVMDAYEIANFTKRARDLAYVASGGNINDPYSSRTNVNHKYPSYMIPYIEGQQGLPSTDWQDEIYRPAGMQNYNVGIAGGNEDVKYYISGGYLNQKGILINSGLQRYSSRANIDANIAKNLRLGANFNVASNNNKLINSEGAWWQEGVVITSLMYHPNLPAYNEDGSIQVDRMMQETRSGTNVANIQNPVALARMITNTLNTKNFVGNTFLEYSILSNLKLKTAFGVESMNLKRNYYRPKSISWSSEASPTSSFNFGFDSRASVYNWISETSLTYDYRKGLNNLNLLGNFSAQKETNTVSLIEGRNFPNDNVQTINAASVTTGSTFDNEATMLSFLGRAMYSFGTKYMLSASLRRDGSSRFAPNHKWGWFPSVSAGWNISQEDFYPANAFVGNLKLRASYGVTGNTNIPFYGGIPVLGNKDYLFGGVKTIGFTPQNSPNDDLSWESTNTLNLGVDADIFNRAVQVSVDAYQSITKDLLLNVTVPATAGLTSSLQNIGKIENKGIEVIFSTTRRFANELTYNGSLVLAANKNKVKALAPGQTQILFSSGLADPSFILRVGEPIGSFFGYQVNGVFKTQEEFNSTPHLTGANQGVGDFIYTDTNNDGKVNDEDRIILGNANPKFSWGFNNSLKWKNIDLGINIQGKHGQQVFNAMHRYLAEAWGNNLNYWGSNEAPRPVWAYGTRSHTRPSSLHVEDASFVRVRNITIGYTFNNLAFTERIRAYFTTTNPFTFTNYSGYNPEVSNNGFNAITAGEDFGNYPTAKSFVFGINFTL